MANTYTYPHIEDYIEIIAGYRAPDGSSKYSIFYTPESPISLARYDVQVVQSFGDQCKNGVAFTDKQAALAASIVLKYERQLAKFDVDVTPMKSAAAFRNPIRQIDRSKRVWVENDQILIKFPFDTKIIETVRGEAKESKGKIHWDHSKKIWVADLTEHNVNWVHAFSKAHEFEIAPELDALMLRLLDAEKTPYKIELEYRDNLISVKNAPDSLIEYVNEHLGGFSSDNLLTLVDNSSLMGYTVEPVISETVTEAYGKNFYKLCSHRELQVGPQANEDYVAEIIKYANATNRWPIYVYEPSLANHITELFASAFPDSEVCKLVNKFSTISPQARVVCVEKIPKIPVNRIPLLVSTAGMLFGGDRQIWIQNAEKIVYFTGEVFNKTNQGKEICKLD